MPTVLSAPDKWRGTATAAAVAAAVGKAAGRLGWTVDMAAVSDGGEGFVDCLGGANRLNRVAGPLGRPVEARWRMAGEDAYLEMAQASGLTVAGGPRNNDPLNATTRGTGELIAVAIHSDARRVFVGLGGSASTDGGLGCFEVLASEPRLSKVELVAACDVMLPFAAALDFARQKGASAAQVRLLEGRLERVAQIYEAQTAIDVRAIPGAGAAGGLGGGLVAMGASLRAGIEVVADCLALEDRMAAADLVVTGEGLLDAHSFHGKAVGWIAERAAAMGVPVLVIVGDQEPGCAPEAIRASDTTVVSIVERYGSDEARSNTLGCIEAVVDEHLRR